MIRILAGVVIVAAWPANVFSKLDVKSSSEYNGKLNEVTKLKC